jgi:predicted O-linked N-acetylglucosamine transferase (SPINDLY family)
MPEAAEAMSAAPQGLPPTGDEHIQCYNRAGASSAAGRQDEALRWYDRAIALKPGFAEAHNNRGLLLAGLGRHREAVDAFLLALESRPSYARALNNLGLSQLALAEPAQALACFDSALRAQPDYFAAIANRAEAQFELGEHAAAVAGYEQALRLNPASWKVLLGLGRTNHAMGDALMAARWFSEAARVLASARLAAASDPSLDIAIAEALQGTDRGKEAVQILEAAATANRRADLLAALGIALTRGGDLPRALKTFDHALRADPRNMDALCGLAALKQRQEELAAAIALYERALVLRPRRADLHYRKGGLQQSLHQHDAAVEAFMTAASLRPRYIDALMACSASLAALRRFDEAVGCLDEVLKIDPGHVPAMSNWGAVLADMGAYEPALEQYERALAVDPRAYAVLCNRGVAAATLHRSALAIDSFRRAAEVAASAGLSSAEIAAVKARLLDAVAAACDWDDYEELRHAALAALRAGLALSPFVAITFADDPALHLEVARQYGGRQHPQLTPYSSTQRRYAHDRIRVAYLSADLHDHATAYLMAGLFEQHDRSRFEITTVSFGPDDPNSSWRQRIRAASERFIEASSQSDAQVAARLAGLEIDIAVDLKGYTLGCRTGILAQRPAPVQVNYLGFPGSMGVPCIDYIIADHELVPADARTHYAEKVVRLPGCYQINDDRRPGSAGTPSRHSQDLPEEAMVFCSFNASYKITPELFAAWMRILARSPGSVLWQLQRDAAVRDNLRRQATRLGVDPQRLLFAETVPVTEHLARIACADLFLDTLPVNAHTTASDALWAGVPILTQRGRSFAGRVCSSLLHATDLAELVVDSTAAYEELAVALAADRPRLAALRARAAAARHSPLFDTARTTRQIEAAFHQMWQRHQAGQQPDHFDVQSILQS